MPDLTTDMFGGAGCPLGLSIQFIEADERDVIAALPGGLADVRSTPTGIRFPRALEAMLPFQAPWTRMMTAQVGPWTALANNHIGGGDPSAPGPAIMRTLGVRCVVAKHGPMRGPGHAQTQLEVMGPGGVPPLMYIRTVSATASDGRWGWYESGDALPFEETERYTRRLTRERFDRPMLLRYLTALGIAVDDAHYGLATLHQRQVSRPSREVTLEQARADYPERSGR